MGESPKIPIPFLETTRLKLRPIVRSDAPRIQLLFNNFEVLRYMAKAIPWPYPEDGASEFLDFLLPEMEALKKYAWAIERKGFSGEGLIGTIMLTPDAEEDSRGFWLGQPYWGKGYMREAVIAVNDFGFERLGMTEMRLNNAEPNVASHRLKEFSGAEILAIEETEYIGGTFPGVKWRLTAEAWRQNRPGIS